MAVFLYVMQHKREYAILRTLGVPKKQANSQLLVPILLMGVLGTLIGGLPSWNYAINQAKASLSTLPTPAGVYPSADLSPFFLAGLCVAIFLLLALFSWLGVLLLSHKPVYELLQGQASRPKSGKKQTRNSRLSGTFPSSGSTLSSTIHSDGNAVYEPLFNKINPASPRKYDPSSLSQYVIHHMLRSKFKSFLTLAIGLIFMLASGWILRTMEQSQKEVYRLYDTTVVEADIIQTNSALSKTGGAGFISRKTIDSVLNSGFVKSSILEADTVWSRIGKLNSQDAFTGIFPVYAYDSPETLTSSLADQGSLLFAPGWDISLFAKQWTLEEIQKDGVPAVFPNSLLEQLQLNVGDRVKITDQFRQTYPCVIVGQYSGGMSTTINSIKIQRISGAGDYILIPLSVLEDMESSQTEFTVAHFILDPKKNRELPQFRADMEKAMGDYGAGVGDIRFIIWDEELKLVVAQLEKNISLLQVLYPVLIAVSVLIGAGLCFLLLVQAAKEAAILRMLGTTKTAVRLTLISEPFLLSIIGVIIGLVAFRFLWTGSGLVLAGPLLLGAGLYLAGVLVGLVIGAISVTSKKPMELLQVKE
jgi:ABC-type antimicrobial peptide transport system permease subunit